jgi:hypothetical protein
VQIRRTNCAQFIQRPCRDPLFLSFFNEFVGLAGPNEICVPPVGLFSQQNDKLPCAPYSGQSPVRISETLTFVKGTGLGGALGFGLFAQGRDSRTSRRSGRLRSICCANTSLQEYSKRSSARTATPSSTTRLNRSAHRQIFGSKIREIHDRRSQ